MGPGFHYVQQHYGRSQIHCRESTLCPVVSRFHEPGKFIYTSPSAYHCGFIYGMNVAKTFIYANSTWLDESRGASGITNALRISHALALPCDDIRCMDLTSLVSNYKSGVTITSEDETDANRLHSSMYFSKLE